MPGTNAVLTFKKAGAEGQDRYLYVNCDAYPSEVFKGLQVALEQSNMQLHKCSLPKTRAMIESMAVGSIPDGIEQYMEASSWQEGPATNFRYEIFSGHRGLRVSVLRPEFENLPDDFRLKPGENFPHWTTVFSGKLSKFRRWAKKRNYTNCC